MRTILIAIVLVGFAVLIMSVKILSKKDGKFPDSHACKMTDKKQSKDGKCLDNK